MKTLPRILTFVLVLLMIIPAVISCSSEKENDKNTDTTTVQDEQHDKPVTDPSEETTAPEGEDGKNVSDDIPEELDYKGKEVSIFHWIAERDEFESDGITGDNVLDAIYERNTAIQERLGVTLTFQEWQGSNGHREEYIKQVEKSYQSGEKLYDIVASYSRIAAQIAMRGIFADLNAIDGSYIDLDKPWWPDALIDTAGVGDSLYYVSGDASTNTLHFMYTIYYNIALLEDLGLEDPVQFVDDHKWTIDKLIEMSSNKYVDLDADGKCSQGDQYGFSTEYFHVDAFYTGSGLRLVERTNDDNLIRLSNDFFSQKTVDLIDKLGKWMGPQNNDCCVSRYDSRQNVVAPFVNGTVLFMQNRVYVADSKSPYGLNEVEWKYGLVPTPLYDETQENYITVIGNPFTLYAIMTDCDNKEMMTAVLECWGSEAYRLTTPQIFESNMKYKYTQVAPAVRMFDILRETSSFDQGRLYANTLGPYISEIPSRAATDGRAWSQVAKSYKKPLENQMKNIIKAFQSIH